VAFAWKSNGGRDDNIYAHGDCSVAKAGTSEMPCNRDVESPLDTSYSLGMEKAFN
jgi:hypothetical protein